MNMDLKPELCTIELFEKVQDAWEEANELIDHSIISTRVTVLAFNDRSQFSDPKNGASKCQAKWHSIAADDGTVKRSGFFIISRTLKA